MCRCPVWSVQRRTFDPPESVDAGTWLSKRFDRMNFNLLDLDIAHALRDLVLAYHFRAHIFLILTFCIVPSLFHDSAGW